MFGTLRLATVALCGALAAYVAFPDPTPVTGLLLDGRNGRLMFADDGDAVQPAGDATELLMAHLLAEAAQTPSASPIGGEKAVLAARLNRQAADLGLDHTRFTLSGDVLSGVTTANDLAEATRALETSRPGSHEGLRRRHGTGATPVSIQRIGGLPCSLPGRGAACRRRLAESPVVAVVMGDGVDSIADVLALAGLAWQVVRNLFDGRDVALVQTLASGPVLPDPAPPLRIELV